MLLTGDDTSVELRVLGWEAELEAGEHRDLTDWLDIQARVVDASGSRVHHVSLEVEDALRIGPWLRDAAATMLPSTQVSGEDALLTFIEPGFAVELMSRDQPTVVTHWYFFDPDGLSLELLAFNVRVVRIACFGADLLWCADAWATELTPFLSQLGSQ